MTELGGSTSTMWNRSESWPLLLQIPNSFEELESMSVYLASCSEALRRPEDAAIYQVKNPQENLAELEEKIVKQGRGGIAILPALHPWSQVLLRLPDVEHHVLWSPGRDALPTGVIRREVNLTFPDRRWINVTRTRGTMSVPQRWHTHVFVDTKNPN